MRRVAIGIIIVVVLLTCAKAFMNQFTDGVNDIFPSDSPEESKKRDIFVAAAKFEPAQFSFEGRQLEVATTWVEHESHLRHRMIWIPYREIRPRYRLCFTLRSGYELFLPPHGAKWTLEGSRTSFSVLGGERHLFFETLDSVPRRSSINLVTAETTRQVATISVDEPQRE